jgi:uncharacterized membrane protein
MNHAKSIAESALAGLLALGVTAAVAGPAATPTYEHEKCYGVVKAGKNDCQTSTHACAGQANKDRQGDSWIYVPKGTCDKIAGGSTSPGK